jgi:flagellar hook-length control protein FliK
MRIEIPATLTTTTGEVSVKQGNDSVDASLTSFSTHIDQISRKLNSANEDDSSEQGKTEGNSKMHLSDQSNLLIVPSYLPVNQPELLSETVILETANIDTAILNPEIPEKAEGQPPALTAPVQTEKSVSQGSEISAPQLADIWNTTLEAENESNEALFTAAFPEGGSKYAKSFTGTDPHFSLSTLRHDSISESSGFNDRLQNPMPDTEGEVKLPSLETLKTELTHPLTSQNAAQTDQAAGQANTIAVDLSGKAESAARHSQSAQKKGSETASNTETSSGKNINLQNTFSILHEAASVKDVPPINEVSPTSEVFNKSERESNKSTENPDKAPVHADTKESQNESIAAITIQNKLSEKATDLGLPRFAGEHRQETSSLAAPGAAPASDTSKTIMSRPEQASKPQSPDLLFQMAERIQVQIRDGQSTIRVQLKPENLGHIEINAETTVNGVVARIATESSSVKSYLENNLPLLQQALQDQGLKIERIDVTVQDGFGTHSSMAQSNQARSGQDGRGSYESEDASRIPFLTPQDEISVDLSTLYALNSVATFHTVA